MTDTHNRKIIFENSSKSSITVWIEPWPHEFKLKKGQVATIVGHWPDERFNPHIEVHKGGDLQIFDMGLKVDVYVDDELIIETTVPFNPILSPEK